MNEQKEKTQLEIAILTPYLYKSFDELRECMDNFDDVMDQIVCYGFDPDNLSNIQSIETPNYSLTLKSKEEYDSAIEVLDADLAIVGSSREFEEIVRSTKWFNDGPIFARYSIFYGKASGYTDTTPEDGGYALDIPKSPEAVKCLLICETFLEGIVEKNASKIRSALKDLSGDNPHPILATPYLDVICGGE